jgi:precorrin-6B methylase 2
MDIALLLSDPAQHFISRNLDNDPVQLMLAGRGVPGIPLKHLVQQIKSRKIARDKLPQWFKTPGLVYGPSKSLEQCSSEITAWYKSQLVSGKELVDLTGGLGVDHYYLAKNFDNTTYVEQDPWLCSIADNNFKALGAPITQVINQSAEEYIEHIQRHRRQLDCVFIDPDRRPSEVRHHIMDQYRPNIRDLLPRLWPHTQVILLKLSTMQDIKSTVHALGNVQQVYVVAVENECKELVFLLRNGYHGIIHYTGVNFTTSGQQQISFSEAAFNQTAEFADPNGYLYQPNSSLMKLGAFGYLGNKYGIKKLHPNSHLYSSKELVANFPGRIFEIQWTIPYKAKKVASLITSGKANVAARNFPLDVKAIRKQCRLEDGGDDYLFFTTGCSGQLMVINGKRLSSPSD